MNLIQVWQELKSFPMTILYNLCDSRRGEISTCGVSSVLYIISWIRRSTFQKQIVKNSILICWKDLKSITMKTMLPHLQCSLAYMPCNFYHTGPPAGVIKAPSVCQYGRNQLKVSIFSRRKFAFAHISGQKPFSDKNLQVLGKWLYF